MEITAPGRDAPLILVADDVSANVELLFDQLHVLGFRATAATDGPSALQACFDQKPDLCILDVSMPAGDLGCDDRSTGFEVCRRIKRDPRTKSIPVIFVTALNDTTDRVKAIEAGGDDFLTKPHNRLVLGARVRSLLKLKAATDALEASLRKQRELEKLRDDLMKMIVHDLKTPLTSVLATMEMLLDGDFGQLADLQRKVLADAEAKAEDLLALINDLLEVSRIEEAEITLDLQPIAPAALLSEVAHEWALRFQQEGATATIDVSDDAPVFEADKALLKRVLGNLVQNSLTHSASAVRIQLSARKDGDGILFTVLDNGPGIPPEYHEVIFRKFERVKTPNVPKTRSSGLGLAFCKLVADAHGGRIWVQSAGNGQGSAFHLALPLKPAAHGPRGGQRNGGRVRVYLKTFGCRANHYDSEAVRAFIQGSGHELADTACDADVAIFNSCAVTSQAVADLRKSVRRVARTRPELRSIVMGCAAGFATSGESGLSILPTVTNVIPGADLPALATALGLPPQAGLRRQTRQSGTRALLRTQDGCDEHCTFCATTLARGPNRSRPMAELVEEARTLAEAHGEIVLTGIHIGSYGHDRGQSLGQLLALLVREVPEVRFRLSSIEATELDAQLLELLTKDVSRVCPHLHAPLQSGSDSVLKRMGRHWYTSDSYRRVVQGLVQPGSPFALGADVIAGFPGETEDDHRRTLNIVEELPFTYLHVFPYSMRSGTAAERLGGRVPPAVAERRARELRAAGAAKASAYAAARVGGTADVIILSGPVEQREGITADYLTVFPANPSAPRGARFRGRLALDGQRLVATAIE